MLKITDIQIDHLSRKCVADLRPEIRFALESDIPAEAMDHAVITCGDWLYRRVAGIEPLEGGYKHFRIAPMPGGGLTWAKADIQTPYGHASSHWEIHGGEFSIQVVVPVSTECTLCLPDGSRFTLLSGTHRYRCPI